jgi:NH3-dependent NAD+ synthetase
MQMEKANPGEAAVVLVSGGLDSMVAGGLAREAR